MPFGGCHNSARSPPSVLFKLSVVGNSGSRYIPACYDVLYDWLQPGERFDVSACSHDTVSPCPPVPPSPPLGHHLSRSPKTGQPFSVAIAKQDAPVLFSSRRFAHAVGVVPSSGAGRPATRAGKGPGASSTSSTSRPPPHPEPLSDAQRQSVAVVLGAQGEDCEATCAKRAGGQCAAEVLAELNSCDALQGAARKAAVQCEQCVESKGAEQPALERGRCLVSRARPYFGDCAARHERTRRFCPCFPSPPEADR